MNPLLTESLGGTRVVTLNRPALLNALSLEMLAQLHGLYQGWGESPEVACIILKGTGPKAFCSGGDVRTLVDRRDSGHRYAEQFFRMEYATDDLISRLKKPHLAIWDGITMGGGVGLSLHGSYRLATEQTVLAMPEVRIGLFPDVGTAFELSRLPDQIGFWLALTGARLSGPDCFALGLATHFASSSSVPELLGEVRRGKPLEATLPTSEKPLPTFEDQRAAIAKHFSQGSVEAIVESLRGDASSFAQECLADLAIGCPLSQKITLDYLLRARHLSLRECFQMDFRIIMRLVVEENFQQGVHALLTKQPPLWRPNKLDKISDEAVQAYFVPSLEELVL